MKGRNSYKWYLFAQLDELLLYRFPELRCRHTCEGKRRYLPREGFAFLKQVSNPTT